MLPEELFTRLVEDQAASDQPGSSTARRLGLLTVFGTLGTTFLLKRSGEVPDRP
ncbi:hypothetical protein ACFQ1L_36420 [Phytohabitans flavus]|uniref:hypothetical protein n=1 Tax=Phytohabitans flavus TaxID=1076124 RepID=UPI001563D2AC|nr:hypothetical protein [Phytohabitans flavus]